MYQRKTPKSQKSDKTAFTAYNPHSISLEKRNWNGGIRIISIDPGIRNFALRVESRGFTDSSYPIKTLVFDKLHIKEAERRLDEDNTDNLYVLLSNFLDQYLEIFKTCHLVLIERQMPFNYKATRVAQHTLSYFMIHLKNLKPLAMICEIDSKLKGKELGASNHLNERGIKAWAIEKAKELSTKRRDYDALEILNKHKKKADDLSDTICQIEAFFSYKEWPLTKEVITLSSKKKVVEKTLTLKVVG